MRVLILLANLCVLICPAKVYTIFASKFVLANVCVLIFYTTHGRIRHVYIHGFTEPMRVLILLAK